MLGAGLWRRVAGTGATIGAVSLAAAVWAQASDRPWQSVLFTTLGFAQLGVALAVRSRRSPGAPRNPLLAVAVAVSLALQVAAVQVPVLRALLGTEPLDGVEFAMCAALATVPGLLLVAARRWSGRRSRRASAPARAASRPADPNVGTDEVTQVVERSLR
jgi:Ca2+-transporting ATPase